MSGEAESEAGRLKPLDCGGLMPPFQHQARLWRSQQEGNCRFMVCARRAPWSAAAKLPPLLFGLLKAAASRPHSKGFAAVVTQLEFLKRSQRPASDSSGYLSESHLNRAYAIRGKYFSIKDFFLVDFMLRIRYYEHSSWDSMPKTNGEVLEWPNRAAC
jgi:hypothetical protein